MKQRNRNNAIEENASRKPAFNTMKGGAFAEHLIHYLLATASRGMQYKILAIVISLLIAESAFATDQVLDVIIYKDTLYYIHSKNILDAQDYPLEPLINKLFVQDSIGRQKVDSLMKCYHWNLRGYCAEWEIRNDSLILNSIKHPSSHPENVPLSFLFEDKDVKNGVFADWYSGILRVINIVPYHSIYNTDIVVAFLIQNGCIIAVRENKKWKKRE
jgi:hypothetical protein